MGQQLPIGSIITNRMLEPGDSVDDLAKHIRDSGLQIPILVNQDYELIDGLRRLEAVRSLGSTVIEAVPVTMFEPATVWLERARLHGVLASPLTPRRIWEIYEVCKPLIAISRSQQMRGSKHGRGVHIHGRERFLSAIGIDSESYFQAVTQLYRMTREDNLRGRLAQEAVTRVERGQMTVYSGLEYVRTRRRPGNVVKADEQLTMLDNVVSSLAGMGIGISQLGPIDPSVPADKLAEYTKELRGFRRTLHQLIKQLEGNTTS